MKGNRGAGMFLIAGAKEMENERSCARYLLVREEENRPSVSEILGIPPPLWKDAPSKPLERPQAEVGDLPLSPRGTTGLWVGPRYILSASISIWLFQAQLFRMRIPPCNLHPTLDLTPQTEKDTWLWGNAVFNHGDNRNITKYSNKMAQGDRSKLSPESGSCL